MANLSKEVVSNSVRDFSHAGSGHADRFDLAPATGQLDSLREEVERLRRVHGAVQAKIARHAALRAEVTAALQENDGTLCETLHLSTRTILRHLGGAFAGVWMFDDAENTLELRAISSSPANPEVHHAGCPVGEFQVGFIVQQQAPYLTDDVLHDENLNDRQWVERNGIVAFASYPLVAGHRAFGVVGLFARHKLEPDTLEALQIVADGLTQGIARDRAESALRQSQAQLEQAQTLARLGSFEFSGPTSQNAVWSRECYQIIGLDPTQGPISTAEFIERVVHPDDRTFVADAVQQAMLEAKPYSLEYRIVRRDGTIRHVQSYSYLVTDECGAVLKVIGTIHDITERKWVEIELRRLNRALRVLSACNRTVNRNRDEGDLLEHVCRMVVEAGGYRTAWVGYAEQDEAKTVRVVAHAGGDADYLNRLKITWAETARGLGTTGRAIRSGRPVACQHILSDPSFAPWRDDALAQGYRASVALPLLVEGQTIGALSIYAEEPDAFDAQELDLLQQTADDLAHGISACRAEQQRRHAEQALRRAEQIARGHATVISATLESIRIEPSADAFVGHALRTIVEHLGAIGGSLWVPSDNLRDARVVLNYDFGRFQRAEELDPDHPGRIAQWFPEGAARRWQEGDAEPVILDSAYIDANPAYARFRAWARRLGVRSVLLVPLILGEEVLGAIAVRFSQQRSYTAEELQLAKSLALQATLVSELTRLRDHSREAAVAEERERAARDTAEELRSANAALQRTLWKLVGAHDLAALLQHILREASDLVRAKMSAIYLHDEPSDTLRLVWCVAGGEVMDVAADERFVFWRTPAPAPAIKTWQTIAKTERPSWFTYSEHGHEVTSYAMNWHRAMGHESLLAVPLMLGDRALGFMGLYFDHESAPAQERIELARVFGHQAALALQLARLAERAQQAAVSEERLAQLGRTNEALTHTLDRLVSESSVDTALADMLIAVSQHLGVASSSLWLCDDVAENAHLHLVYDRGQVVPGAETNHPDAGKSIRLTQCSLLHDRLMNGDIGITPVAPEYGFEPQLCDYFQAQGVRSILAIPMKAGGALRGCCLTRLSDQHQPSAEQVEFARILVQQATLVLEVTHVAEVEQQAALSREREHVANEKAEELEAVNQALRQAEQLARAHASVIANTLQSIAREHSLEAFLGQVLKTIVENLGGQGGTFWEPGPEPDTFVVRLVYRSGELQSADQSGHPGRAPQKLAHLGLRIDQPCEPLVLRSYHEGSPEEEPFREWMRQQECLSALQLPLVIGGKVFGACTVRFASDREFGVEELTLAKALALQATLALQLARLEQQSRGAAVLDERNRMARDIHDTLAQGLTGVVIQLEAAKEVLSLRRSREVKEHIQRAIELARQSLAEARRSVHALRPMVLEQGSLIAALEGLLQRMTSGTGIDARLSLDGIPWRLPPDWEEHLLHIGQEALANALRHANPKSFHVRIAFEAASIVLTLRDDGVGFDVTQTAGGLGLASMRERVVQLGGRLSLRTALNAGTEIIVILDRREPTTAQAGVVQ